MLMRICGGCNGHGGPYSEEYHKNNPQMDFLLNLGGPTCSHCGGSGVVPEDSDAPRITPYEYKDGKNGRSGGLKTGFGPKKGSVVYDAMYPHTKKG